MLLSGQGNPLVLLYTLRTQEQRQQILASSQVTLRAMAPNCWRKQEGIEKAKSEGEHSAMTDIQITDIQITDIQITDVLVVGAGPVGLTLAIDLARRGIACRIIEQASTYQIGTRGRGISLRSQEVFEDLGVLAALFPYDESIGPGRTYDHDKLVSESNPASFFPAVPPPYRPILMLNQQHTEAKLRERLVSYGLNVELGCQLVSFTQDAECVVAKVAHAGPSAQVHSHVLS